MKITIKDVDQIMKKWKDDKEYLIEMLQDIQESCRYLPKEALRHIAHTLDVPLKNLYHISTFFSSFSLEEKGEHIVQVCMGTACHVKGAPAVLDAFARELKIEPGQTTKDKKFTIEGVRCIGCCSLAPAVAIGEKIYGGVTPAQVPEIIENTKDGGKSMSPKKKTTKTKAVTKKSTGKCACKTKKTTTKEKIAAKKKVTSKKKIVTKKKAASKKTVAKKKATPKKKIVTKKKAAPKKTVAKKKATPKKKVAAKKKAAPKKTVAKKKATPKKKITKKKGGKK